MNNKYLSTSTNNFFKNAGIIGFLRMSELTGLEKNVDYIITEQELLINVDIFSKYDMSQKYIDACISYFEKDTKYYKYLLEEENISIKIDNLKSVTDNTAKKSLEKDINNHFSELVKMLDKNSFKSGYIILEDKGINIPIEELYKQLKAEKDIIKKYNIYKELIIILNKKEVKEVLIMKELLYSKLDMFFSKGLTCYLPAKLKTDIAKCYEKDFITPLKNILSKKSDINNNLIDNNEYSIYSIEDKNGKMCIDCGIYAKEEKELSFVADMIDDLARKKSYYWNCKVNAHLCPVCAFIYSFAPIGFTFLINNSVFINNNTDIYTMYAFNQSINTKIVDKDQNQLWYRIQNQLLNQAVKETEKKLDKIQVIFRTKNSKNIMYHFNIIDEFTINILKQSKTYLSNIINKFIPYTEEYINVYQEVIDYICNKKSLYGLIYLLLKTSVAGSKSADYTINILLIQIYISTTKKLSQKGDNNMVTKEDNVKRAFKAKYKGTELRSLITSGLKTTEEKENKLRGMVYQLLNAVSMCNKEKFLDVIIRAYSAYSKPVPNILLETFQGDSDFQEIGYAFIIGLKSNNKDNNDNDMEDK